MKLSKQELQETVRQQGGMTFKFKWKDGKFIHTLCDGELLYRIGLTPEIVIGKELSQIFTYEKAKYKEQNYRLAWKGKENVSYEGEENGICYLVSLRPIKRKGKVVEVIASCVDITERKNAEAALRNSENYYRLVAENISDAINVADENGVILYTSASSEILKGYPSDQLVGSSLFSFVYPNDLLRVINAFNDVIRTKTPNSIQYRYIHKNKTLIYLEAQVTPVIEENGDIQYLVIVARDITEQESRKPPEKMRNTISS